MSAVHSVGGGVVVEGSCKASCTPNGTEDGSVVVGVPCGR